MKYSAFGKADLVTPLSNNGFSRHVQVSCEGESFFKWAITKPPIELLSALSVSARPTVRLLLIRIQVSEKYLPYLR